MITLETFKKLLDGNGGRFPLLTLDEFFNGNTAEDSIAPNQCGYGRPALAEIEQALLKIEALPNVAWVRVTLHDDTEIRACDGEEALELCGETIVICTTAEPAKIEKLVNCQ